VQADRRQQQKDCVNFSFKNLRKDQRREWYLNDPQMLKAETPARMEGITPALSSMQKFAGEEGDCPTRKREQRTAQVDWLMAQMAEKKLREELEKDLDRRDDAALLKANELRFHVDIAALKDQKEEVMETARENEQMAICRSARQKTWRERESAAKRDHMMNVVEHNRMREKYDYTIGLNGKKRDYKRCSYDEEIQSWAINKQLAQAKRDRAASEVDTDSMFRRIGETMQHVGDVDELAWNQDRIRRRQKFDAENTLLAKEMKEKKAVEMKEYYSYAPSLSP